MGNTLSAYDEKIPVSISAKQYMVEKEKLFFYADEQVLQNPENWRSGLNQLKFRVENS